MELRNRIQKNCAKKFYISLKITMQRFSFCNNEKPGFCQKD